MSWTWTRLGWLVRAITCASWKKRLRATGSATAEAINSLIATSRPRPGCSARYTAPMPPRPNSRLIRYLPIRRSPELGAGAVGGGTGIARIVAAVGRAGAAGVGGGEAGAA